MWKPASFSRAGRRHEHAAPRYVILDRDGTLIRLHPYLSDVALVEFLPGTLEGLRHMQDLGLGLIVVTNQSGIGRGYFDVLQVKEIHDRMLALLHAGGIDLQGIYVCPHTLEDGCPCRKPEPGLVHQAALELGFKPGECFVIGDTASDIELGARIHATTFLTRTGYGAQVEAEGGVQAHYVVDNLNEAGQIIDQILTDCLHT